MIDQDLLDKWRKEKIITKKQADQMMADIKFSKKERSSDKFIIAISTLGAIGLGIGAILFISANWEELSNFAKVLILVGSTFVAYIFGYYLQYQKQNYPRVGSALIFLSTLLLGATIFLIAQMYHINANNHTLLLIWLLAITPLVYAFQSKPIAGLSALLFYVWLGFFVFRNLEFDQAEDNLIYLPVLYSLAGILVFNFSALHSFLPRYESVARVCRLISIKVIMLALFLLSFQFFSGDEFHDEVYRHISVSSQFSTWLVIIAIIGLIATLINLFRQPTKTSKLEGLISLGLGGILTLFFFLPSSTNIYTIIFNLVLLGIISVLIYIGYQKEDIKLVNIAYINFGFLVVVRYFDFFWDLLPRSAFFMAGGAVFLTGSIFLERHRRKLESQFKKTKK